MVSLWGKHRRPFYFRARTCRTITVGMVQTYPRSNRFPKSSPVRRGGRAAQRRRQQQQQQQQ